MSVYSFGWDCQTLHFGKNLTKQTCQLNEDLQLGFGVATSVQRPIHKSVHFFIHSFIHAAPYKALGAMLSARDTEWTDGVLYFWSL